jgi:general secretion pathway protein D
MKRRSVGSDVRRRPASLRGYCARSALMCSLLLAVMPTALPAQPTDQTPPPPTRSDIVDQPVGPTLNGSAAKNSATGDASTTNDLAVALERTGDLNLHGVSLNDALFMIGEQWNINVVAGEVQGKVNGAFKEAPLREILDSILLSNGYNYRAVGKSLVVSSVEELGQINPFFQSATIPVRSADIDEIVEGAKLLSTPKGSVRALKSAHSIVVLDFPDRVKMIRDFVAAIESASSGRFASPDGRNGLPLEVGYFRTQHIAARTAETVIQTILSQDGRVAVMEKEDRLLVTDYPENLAMVEKVLDQIDHPRPQVRITALIYDISLQDLERIGINWGGQGGSSVDIDGDGSRTRDTALDVDSIMQVPFQAGATGSTLTFLNLSRHIDITAVVLALQQASDARLLANPNVAVLENEEAIFERVSEIPYQQLTETQQGGSIGTTAFKKAGITLHVRPKIAAEGLIQMLVEPEISRLTGFTPGDNQPIIDISSTSTVLSVGNRQTVVIGGLRQRSDVGDFTGVPYLKDVNILGRLFRSRDTDVRESELVVFISPEIISYADDPTLRQQMAADTVRCRLDQIPEAEGCPPCCRRLPPDMSPGGPCVEVPLPAEDIQFVPADGVGASIERLPPPQPYVLPPMSAEQILSAEFQFGTAGRSAQVRALVAENRLRRLPQVAPASAIAVPAMATNALFGGPPAPPVNAENQPAAVLR